jgi:hypothetical protein
MAIEGSGGWEFHDKGLIQLWDDQCVQLPPNAPIVIGKAAIRQAIEASDAANKSETFMIRSATEVGGYGSTADRDKPKRSCRPKP